MKNYHLKLTKRTWYLRGAFANPNLFRRANSNGGWGYYQLYGR